MREEESFAFEGCAFFPQSRSTIYIDGASIGWSSHRVMIAPVAQYTHVRLAAVQSRKLEITAPPAAENQSKERHKNYRLRLPCSRSNSLPLAPHEPIVPLLPRASQAAPRGMDDKAVLTLIVEKEAQISSLKQENDKLAREVCVPG